MSTDEQAEGPSRPNGRSPRTYAPGCGRCSTSTIRRAVTRRISWRRGSTPAWRGCTSRAVPAGWNCREAFSRRSKPTSPRRARRREADHTTASGWAWRRRPLPPSAPRSSSESSCGRCSPESTSTVSCSVSRVPDPTWPGFPPARCATATTGSSTGRRSGRRARRKPRGRSWSHGPTRRFPNIRA